MCFDLQLKMIRQEIFEKFDREIRKLSKKDEVSENFTEISMGLFEEYST